MSGEVKSAAVTQTPVYSVPPHLSGSPKNQLINSVLLATTGFFIGGPSNMISSAISADLGRQEALRGSQEALATVTGIVDGTGSIGAALGQVGAESLTCVRVCKMLVVIVYNAV